MIAYGLLLGGAVMLFRRNKLRAVGIRFVACILSAVWKFDEGNGHAIAGDDDGFVAGVRERINFNELHHSLCGKVGYT